MTDYDVIIVGGGLVGMAAALGLAQSNHSVCLLESHLPDEHQHQSYDDRTLVVNRASKNFWNNLEVWSHIESQSVPIKSVHVFQKGRFGSCTFDSSEFEDESLADIIAAKVLGMELYRLCNENALIDFICPARYKSLEHTTTNVSIEYKSHNSTKGITAKLVLAADGALSKIRNDLNLQTQHKDYQLTAIVANVTPELSHQNRAFECLTDKGPSALLPFHSNRCGLVWTTESNHAKDLLSLSDQDFIKSAQKQFGYRLGKFIKVGKRASYPLHLIKVPEQGKNRVILIGNAAHVMSPVSAQGLNLAVRDLAHLIESIENGNELGSDEMLQDYFHRIKYDQQQTIKYTDDLMSWFRIDESVVNFSRSVGLFALNQSKSLKKRLYARVSGFKGKSPGMLRGANEIL